MKTVSLVLVVYNEEGGLKELLPQMPLGLFDEVLAVDGNSTDSTRYILEKAGIKTYIQTQTGLGAAMFEGRNLVTSDAFIFFHPDGNEDPKDFLKMRDLLKDGREFVVASRMIPGARNEEDDCLFKWRKWANMGFAFFANIFFAHNGNKTTDITNGFRGISCSTFDRMKLTSTDLTLDFQMVIHALKLGIPITEFPTNEMPRIAGGTKFPSISTGIAELKLLYRELLLGRRDV